MPGFIEVEDSSRRVTKHWIDQVGNNLTATLAWCQRHDEPIWLHSDGSFVCWWEMMTGHRQHLEGCGPDDHEVITGPWEIAIGNDDDSYEEVRSVVVPVHLLKSLVDPDPCRFDHNGGCQAHGFLSLEPGETCPEEQAKQLIAHYPRNEV